MHSTGKKQSNLQIQTPTSMAHTPPAQPKPPSPACFTSMSTSWKRYSDHQNSTPSCPMCCGLHTNLLPLPSPHGNNHLCCIQPSIMCMKQLAFDQISPVRFCSCEPANPPDTQTPPLLGPRPGTCQDRHKQHLSEIIP